MPNEDNSSSEEITQAPAEEQLESTEPKQPESEQPTETPTEETLYAGKFKSIEELEEGYNNLQKNFTQKRQDISRARVEETPKEDISKEAARLRDEVPQDIVAEMLKEYKEKKSQEAYKAKLEMDSETYDKETVKNPHLSDAKVKKILLKLGQLPEYQTTPFAEIYRLEYGQPEEDTSDLDSSKKAAGSVKGTTSKPTGKKKWTAEAINALSAEEYKKLRPEIIEQLST